jgi:hypothetical protein
MNFSLFLFSNHGGRQVDTIVPAIECLEDIINVVDGRAEGKFHLIIIIEQIFNSQKISEQIFSESYRIEKSEESFEP